MKSWVLGIEDYRPLLEQVEAIVRGLSSEYVIYAMPSHSLLACHGKQPGDPQKGAEIVVDLVRGEGSAKGKEFPRFLLLGRDCYEQVKEKLEKALLVIEEWKEATQSTDF